MCAENTELFQVPYNIVPGRMSALFCPVGGILDTEGKGQKVREYGRLQYHAYRIY
jgi:hypothetical protein